MTVLYSAVFILSRAIKHTYKCKGKWMNIKGFIKILWPTVIILPKQKLISKLIYLIFIKLDGE